MNILMYIFVFFSVVVGVGSTFAILFTMFGTIFFKIYRKIKYGISLYD